MLLRAARLSAGCVQRALDLGGHIGQAEQVGAGLRELELGLVPARPELRDPGRLLEEDASLGGAHREHLTDAPLLDDRVGARSEPGVHEVVGDVLEAHAPATHAVLGGAVPHHAARDVEPALGLGPTAVGRDEA